MQHSFRDWKVRKVVPYVGRFLRVWSVVGLFVVSVIVRSNLVVCQVVVVVLMVLRVMVVVVLRISCR